MTGDTGDTQDTPTLDPVRALFEGHAAGLGAGLDPTSLAAVSPTGFRAALLALISAGNSSNAARASAIRTLAEMDGLVGRFQQSPHSTRDTPPAELSRSGLMAELTRLRRACGVGDTVSHGPSAKKPRTKAR